MRNSTLFMSAIHIALYVSIFLDVSVLRQCIGFVYLAFLPGFIILRALNAKTKSPEMKLSLSVSLSIAFVMFVGLLANTLYPLLGISAPLSTFPITITISALTLAIFVLDARASHKKEIGNNSNMYSKPLHAEIDPKGVVLCAISISFLGLSILGAAYDSVYLMASVILGTAAIVFTSIFLYKRIPSSYYAIVLFVVSLSLILQTSLISRHLMGWDIFEEYYVHKSVRAVGCWTPPGPAAQTFTSVLQRARDNLNSILSVTILPTVYSTVLNLDGELIFKIIYPLIFSIVPIFLFMAFETQTGKIVAFLSVFFFIADPNNLYGLAPLSLMREMITFLFLSGVIFCFVKKDMDLNTRRALVMTFFAGLAVSHYSFAFISALLIVFVFAALRIFGRKDELLNLTLALYVVGITFAWYMYVAPPPLDSLTSTVNNIVEKFTADVFTTENRVDPGMTALSPTSQAASLNGLIHKVVIYVCVFFVAVGAIVLTVKPKEFKFHPVYRWMAIFAASLLVVCVAVPNLAPALNFMRFYRYVMIFLAPLYILGGIYFLGLFRKIANLPLIRRRFAFKDLRLLVLTILLVVFFLYRSGFVTTVTARAGVTDDDPYSYSLDFNRMKRSTFFTSGGSLYSVYFPEQDLFGARWLAPKMGNDSLVYAEWGLGEKIFVVYVGLEEQNYNILATGTQQKSGSYIYLRGVNVVGGVVMGGWGYFGLSDLNPSLSQDCKIYSNGYSDVYFVPG